ncbi:hypothetical protein O3G_MSEX009813 [Manduca sexta]|uniref:DNA polymerase n=1 Tax=Manduca sexta TaxID=7130 RepID=A0A922CSU5_MANSE|nr:hypothetical protein O3G_MSEX009813 [Manduca sexta]
MASLDCTSHTKPQFSVRIVVCDHYLTKPVPGVDVIYSEFRGSDIKQVPVLRIFGPTPDGYKACLHIHGVFPYFYIPCPTPNPAPQFLYQIAASLDKALNIALKQASSANQHVYKITLVKGLPFYGFHDKEHLYLKVFLYNPVLIRQAVELCSNGAILGQTLQPHESHLNFTLQFFIDFNLFGMSYIDIQNVLFRKSNLSQNSNDPIESPNEFGLKPESTCFFEADCVASSIINRQRIGKGDGVENPGLEEVWHQEMERRKQLNVSLASKSLSQGRMQSEETESHYKFDQIIKVKLSNLIEKPVVTSNEISKIQIEPICYPAESMEGSLVFKAVDVSVHLPNSSTSMSFNETSRNLEATFTEECDDTLVDENIALNTSLSLHYSQVLLNSEDLDLVDMLGDMDEKPIEDDSIMGTPANIDNEGDIESDNAEYSQIFDEETILLDNQESKGEKENSFAPSWNDSFWEGVNIPQLDGTCDDDHVKKVRKRRIRLKLGLSKPKNKKNETIIHHNGSNENSHLNISQVDEIDTSREEINITGSHLRKDIKVEPHSVLDTSKIIDQDVEMPEISNKTVTDLVNKQIKKESIKSNSKPTIAENYDTEKKYEPIAGPSTSDFKNETSRIPDTSMNDSQSSFDGNKLGIMSFYDSSKIFNNSLEFNADEYISTCERDINIEKSINARNIDINAKFYDVNKIKRENDTVSLDVINKSMSGKKLLTPLIKPPTKSDVISTLKEYKISKMRNPSPFYSDHRDVGDKVEIGQILLKVISKLSRDQKPFEKVLHTTSIEEWRQLLFLQTNEMSQEATKPEVLKTLLAGSRKCVLEPVIRPPTRKRVKEWLLKNVSIKSEENHIDQDDINKNIDELENSQALGLNEEEINSSLSLEASDKVKPNTNDTLQVTMHPDGSFLCFGNVDNKQDTTSSIESSTVEVNFLTLMLVEVHTSVRGDYNPDPALDPIKAIFYTVTNDCPKNHFLTKSYTEILVIDATSLPKYLDRCIFDCHVTYVPSEMEIIEKLIEIVNKHNPDIMCGYEIEMNSWGYIFERAQVLGLDIIKDISRITEKNRQKRWRSDDKDLEGKIIGRVIFNVWRLFRHELALSSYSFENCMYEILKERVPTYSYAQLSEWWSDESKIFRWIPVEYYLTRLSGTVRMLEKLDIINRTSELARLFGLQWWEVLSRGSQFRVESLMLRAARPLNLVALSPTVKQRAAMRAPECLPLIFEPESRFYSDPVIVLDFQSLYPSMMIAYNYCFSTCIGRVQNIDGNSAYEFGAWRLRIPQSKLETLVKKGLVHWSPVGVGFVKPSVRHGVLPALLRRILAARQAVKKNMKLQTDETVKKAMHSRQLGLKLIANVTYGYTAANFSGRMPCVEVGDSVVAKGRETLERAIKLVQNSHWNAKVVYGDTDSMFVLVPGGTRAEAFEIGQQIADAVTADNPSPVALKLEKVYQPCILQTKKRYVGYMYESAQQETPVYEAKGIETVRRDGCPAGVKLLQQSLCELFSRGDVSAVKRRTQALLARLADGSLPPHQLLFTREYHGAAGYRPGAAAPPNEIAKWSELGYCKIAQQAELVHTGGIARYMSRERCAVCGARVAGAGAGAVCAQCAHTQRAAAMLSSRLASAGAEVSYCNKICESCCGHSQVMKCENTECPVLWRRISARQRLNQTQELLTHLPSNQN